MDGNEIGRAMTSMLVSLVLVALIAGAGLVLLIQWLWPTLKAWIHWATG